MADGRGFLDAVAERVVVYDGATGTWMQTQDLSLDDYGGPAFEGCTDILGVTRPDVVAALHTAYLEVGADVVETNTFGAFAVPLGEYDIPERSHEIALANARIAREVADGFSTPDKPRYVAGSLGPGTKSPSLGQIRFAALRDSYEEACRGLLEGGVDLFILETHFDLLALKAAVIGARRAMAAEGRQVPIQAQVTMELTGRMLLGTEIGAALAAIDPLKVDIVGLNCATGPSEMSEHLRHLSSAARTPISCLPNAGLPSVVDGAMHYDLTAVELRDYQKRFVEEFGVQVIGGCCGTTPEYIQLLAEMAPGLTPAARTPEYEAAVTSIYSAVPLEQDASFLMIGERTNANGSKKFREALLEGDWDTTVAMANAQIKEGAHVLDVCVDYVGRDGTGDMDEVASRFATQANAPLVLDSTEPEVMEAGLQHVGGRAILNSANLEDGFAEGSRLDRVFSLARDYGAAVICLLIDEEGQARTAEWKLRVARRIVDLARDSYGLEESDLIFDALTFPLTTGDEDLRKDAMATMDAIKQIKEEFPGCHTTLGVSNVSFGINPAARHVLNSIFIHEATKHGLDSAIVHASKILPISRIPDEQRDVCLDLIYDRRGTEGLLADGDADYDPLHKLLDIFADVKVQEVVREDRSDWPIEKRLSQRIIDGDRDGLQDELDAAMAGGLTALQIVNDVLLAGMRVVGDLFGKGEMQLPFVLQSAETMKAAVAHLEPHMEKVEGEARKGRIVLATVKGDVHDIGKNLVDIILTNNGYEVFNIGIKVGIGDMIEKALEVEADAIGMSGLLVKSTLIMRDNLEELNTRELDLPVLLGGAALTRTYVERDLRNVYGGRLFYGKDAFEGLHVMDRLGAIKHAEEPDDPEWGLVPSDSEVQLSGRFGGRDASTSDEDLPDRWVGLDADNEVFAPPFTGSKVVKGIALDQITKYINETAIFRNQWQFRPEAKVDGSKETNDEFRERMRPLLRSQLAQATTEGLLNPAVVYGYYPANSDGQDIVIWADDSRTDELTRFRFPRSRVDPYQCITDLVKPMKSDEPDYVAFHIVTMGAAISERTAELFAADKYQDYLLLHGLGVEMAEALAEMWHRRIREEWGFADEDGPSLAGLFRQQYRGGRYSWGYPACPDLEDNERVARLLGAERIGIEVSEDTGYQYQPEQTTSAIILHHPAAKYFVVR
ncbi:methionine synthase [Iamia sp. SCSIO 61187]|uniref:methionine synthase n=1 Tax=Iamia sp. SCSIO 61187 TaxID=2722752 RepID=UPI001C635D61|nr:methionine synthase [Iamia sp. SCSIO 61187]QYG92378.1 methionine synthase [Iamia sp. SCSIO 61187]